MATFSMRAGALLSALAAVSVVVASPPPRGRPIDRIAATDRLPSGMHASTRTAHRREMATWSGPSLSAGAPTVNPVDFGADPTGKADSTAAFTAAMAAVLAHNTSGHRMSDGIYDLGGVVLDLQGGDYLISAPLVVPQYAGNMHIIDGTLRASPTFPAGDYVLDVCVSGAAKCSPPSGQGSCCENVGMSGLTLDGSHVALGCLRISNTMGATLDGSSAIFGFTGTGIDIAGGHETMISETWVAAYFWNDPKKESNAATGIYIGGNDHYVSNTIVFSARVGVHLTG